LLKLGNYLTRKYGKKIVQSHHPKQVNLDNTLKYLKESNHKALFIFDNFFTMPRINIIPNSVKYTFIVTSLSRFDRGETMVLKKLSRESSLALIRQKINCSLNDANLLAEALQDHPLALTQAVAYIYTREGINVEKYLEFYNKSAKELWKNEEGLKHEGSVDKTIFSTVVMTIERLKKENPDSYELLQYFLPYHKTVPISVLKKAYIDNIKSDELGFIEALRSLIMHSLIEEDNKNAVAFSLHDIIAKVLREYTPQNALNIKLDHLMQQCKAILPSSIDEAMYYTIHNEGMYTYMISIALEGLIRRRADVDRFLCRLFEYTLFGTKDYEESLKLMKLLEEYYANNKYLSNNLSYYHTLKGVYYAWRYTDYVKSNSEYEIAISMAKKYSVKDSYEEILPKILMAQNYCYMGDLTKVGKLLDEASSNIHGRNISSLNDGLFFTKAQMYLYEGKPDAALSTILKAQRVPVFLGQGQIKPYQVEWLILYGKILNNCARAEEAYKILKNVYDNFPAVFGTKVHDTYITLCIALMESCYHLKNFGSMKLYLSEVEEHFPQIYDKEEFNQAEYYQFYGDYSFAQSYFKQAFDQYRMSEQIYEKVLIDMKHEDIRRLWKQLIKTCVKLGLDKEYSEYVDKYTKIFGKEDLRALVSFIYEK